MIALFEFHLDFLVFEYVLHGRMAVEVLFSPSMVECFAKVPASAGTGRRECSQQSTGRLNTAINGMRLADQKRSLKSFIQFTSRPCFVLQVP